MNRRAAGLVAALILVTPGRAQAQDFSLPNLDMNILWVASGLDPLSTHLREEQAKSDAVQGRTSTPAETDRALRYSPSPQRRRANLARFVAKTRAGDPAGAAELERTFAAGDFIGILGGELEPYGLKTDNVADAYAAWWVNAWQAWAGDVSDSTAAQARGVSAQAGRALLAAPTFTSANDALKQELAESLLVQAALIAASAEQVKTDPSLKPQLKAAMAQAGRSMGLDFAAMRLTATGFEPIGRTQASAPKAQATAAMPAIPGGGIPPIHKVVSWMGGDLKFHPTVLFADGTSYDIDDASLESSPLGALRSEKPTRWGRWRATGDNYELIDDRGRSSRWVLGDGGLFQSFPGQPGQTLDGRFKSVTGSTVGEMSMLFTGAMTFTRDGRFTTANSFSASGSGDVSGVSVAAGSSSASTGRYLITGHRIVLQFDDGASKDLFFAFGGGGRPPRVDRDMVFIGWAAHVLDD